MSGHLVTTVEEARGNILGYAREVRRSGALQDIMSYARGWYGCRDEAGEWVLAPSKFIGYVANDAEAYLKTHQQRDGRLTERLLGQWFVEIASGSPVHEELLTALRAMFARAAKTPNKRLHLHVLKTDLPVAARPVSAERSGDALLRRITTDRDVLGGRPAIRGLRIGVGDVLDLLAAGASRQEIIADYPYLEDDDISAALEYAARSVDHRVIRAA